MAKKTTKKKPGKVDALVEAAERKRAEQTQEIFDRITAVLRIAIRKWEERVAEDPAYQPSPGDIASIMSARRSCADTLLSYARIDQKLAEARDELESLENRILGILTNPMNE